MGEIIKRKIRGMSWKSKISLVLIFTLVFSAFMYQGWYKPKGAIAVTTAATSPGLGELVQDGGTDWANVTNIYTSNNARASVTLNTGQQSDILRATNFGFAIVGEEL